MLRRGPLWRCAVLVAGVLALTACAASPSASTLTAEPAPALPPENVVDLTIYLRRGERESAVLVPVTRQVPITGDLPRTALELLLQGPVPGDDPDLAAPLPSGVEIRNLQISAGRAEVDLSEALLTHRWEVLRGPGDELLALAAIANTMTEFPSIDNVRLRINGRSSGLVQGHDVSAFWGYWGLPDLLVRDQSVVVTDIEAQREPLLDFTALTAGAQRVGVSGAGPVSIPSVRLQEHICSLRLIVDLAEPGAAAVAASGPVVPASRVLPVGDDLVLQIDGAVLEGVAPELVPAHQAAGVERIALETAADGKLKIRVQRDGDPLQPPRVWLRALDAPTRIVLDIQK